MDLGSTPLVLDCDSTTCRSRVLGSGADPEATRAFEAATTAWRKHGNELVGALETARECRHGAARVNAAEGSVVELVEVAMEELGDVGAVPKPFLLGACVRVCGRVCERER